jgi:hypothetical protein
MHLVKNITDFSIKMFNIVHFLNVARQTRVCNYYPYTTLHEMRAK